MTSEIHQNTCSKKKRWGGGRGSRADAFAQGNLLLKAGLSQTKICIQLLGLSL